MKIDKSLLEKLDDDETRSALDSMDEHDQLRLILTVDVSDDDDEDEPDTGLQPGETRQDMRRRLIKSRLSSRSKGMARVIENLSTHLIEIKGQNEPRLTRKLVVEGSVGNLLKGLELPDVLKAQIDRVISLEQPDKASVTQSGQPDSEDNAKQTEDNPQPKDG